MKVGQIISMLDEMKENDVSDEMKLFWINEVEGMVNSEIMKGNCDGLKPLISTDDEVSVIEPYSKMYIIYLDAMIAFGKGDYDAYFKIYAEFEKVFSDYSKYVIRNRS